VLGVCFHIGGYESRDSPGWQKRKLEGASATQTVPLKGVEALRENRVNRSGLDSSKSSDRPP
jgi:hypothetical protein